MAAKGPDDTASRGALGDAGLLLQESLSFPSTNAWGQMGTRSSVAVPLEQVANLEQGCPLKSALVQGKRAGELINEGKRGGTASSHLRSVCQKLVSIRPRGRVSDQGKRDK